MALALVMWKHLRTLPAYSTDKPDCISLTNDIHTVSDKVIHLAKTFGIKDEFFRILFAMPVMTIEIKNHDTVKVVAEKVHVNTTEEQI